MAATATFPLPSAVEPRRRACVLDAALALSPFGLAVAQRLSAELELWIAPEFWQVLDNTTQLVQRSSSLLLTIMHAVYGGTRDESECRSVLEDSVEQWEMARSEKDLAGLHLYWLNDFVGSSLLPAGTDAALRARFEVLAAALDARVFDRAAAAEQDPVVACARDELALTVALAARHSFIVTLLPAPQADSAATLEPPLCQVLRGWGIPSRRVDDRASGRAGQSGFEELVARANVAELLWAGGFDLAVIHVLARRAAAIPSFAGAPSFGDDYLESEHAPDADWWKDAAVFWYPVSAR